MNLVKNALKFTKRLGVIQVKAWYEKLPKQMLCVEVSDTGLGIAAQDMASLFNRFGKLQRTAELNNEGIGLGLTIVQQIVESASGTVTVQSPGVGLGSTFSFTMQLDPATVDDQSPRNEGGFIDFNQS